MVKPRTPTGFKVFAALGVAVVLLAGVFVAGAVITDDFTVAMVLTAAWMAGFGLLCAAIALRQRQLALPVLGAYLITAAVLGAYLGRSMFVDDTVTERVASAAEPSNRLLGRGSFEPVAHSVRGTASVIEREGGGRVLTLTGFEVDNGPDLRVYIVAGPAEDEAGVKDYRDLGALKGNIGDQQYPLPRGLDLGRYTTVVIWCRAFTVNFARAPL